MALENKKKADRERYDWKFEKKMGMVFFLIFALIVIGGGYVLYRPEARDLLPQESAQLQAAKDVICRIDTETCKIAQDSDLAMKVWQDLFPYAKIPAETNPHDSYPRQITLSNALFEDMSRLLTIYYHELQHVKESNVPYSTQSPSYAQCLDHNHVRLKTREFADKVDALISAGDLPEYDFEELPSHHAYNDFGNRIEVCTQS